MEVNEHNHKLLGLKRNIYGEYNINTLCQEIAVKGGAIAPPIPPSKGLGNINTLYDFQRDGIQKMLQVKNVLNYDQMGLGKTLQTLMYLQELDAKEILIITVKNMIGVWEDEFRKWGLGHMLKDVMITNHEKLIAKRAGTTKINTPFSKMLNQPWDVIVVDEAHKITNRKSKTFLGLMQLESRYRVCLTGTPIKNKVDDLWAIYRFLNPNYFGISYWTYVDCFCEQRYNGFGRDIVGPTKDPFFRNILDQVIERTSFGRQKSEVLKELPEKTYQQIKLELPAKVRKLYKDCKKKLLIDLNADLDTTEERLLELPNALAQLVALQRITSDYTHYIESPSTPKLDYLVSVLEEVDKIVVFSKFLATVETVFQHLVSRGITCVKYTGDLTKEMKRESYDRFKDPNGGIRVFIATVQSAGTGLTLTEASTVVYMDRTFKRIENSQSEDRLHRIGQKGNVLVIDLIYSKTVDEVIFKKFVEWQEINKELLYNG